MIPRKLALRNFMCYRESVPPLELDGITIACLSGENGAGKSALLDALTWALWGEARLRSDDDLIALGADEMMVDLTFALDGQDYRVTRKRSKGRRGQSQLEFQLRHNGSWKVLNPGLNLRETQRVIDETLRMGFETFSNSAFLRQNRADEFTRKEPGKRKQVLADILGLDVYERLEDSAKARAKELDGRTRVLDGQIDMLRDKAEKRELFIGEVARAERAAEQAQQALAEAQAALDKASERVAALEGGLPMRDERRRQIERLSAEREELAREAERRRGHLARAREVTARAEEIRAGAAELEAARAELTRLDGLRDAYDALLERRRAREQALREERSRIESDLRLAEGELRGLRERAARRPAVEQEIRDLRARLEALAPLAGELEAARRSRADLQERSRKVGQLRIEQLRIQGEIDKRRESLVATREELKRAIRKAADQTKDEPRWRAELEAARAERARLEAAQAEAEALRAEESEAAARLGELRAACETIRAQGEQINEKLELLRAGAGVCPLCGGELGPEGAARIEGDLQRERADLRARYSQARRDADAQAERQAAIQARVESLARRAGGLAELAGRIARLERDLAAAEELRARQAEDQRLLDDVQLQLVKGAYEHGLRAELHRVEGEMAGIGGPEQLDAELKRIERRVAELERQLEERARLEAQIQSRSDELRRIGDDDPALHEQELREQELRTTLEMEDYGAAERLAIKQLDAEIAALGFSPERQSAMRARVAELEPWAEQARRLVAAEEWIVENEPAVARDAEKLRQLDAESAEAAAQLAALEQELRQLEPARRERDGAQVRLREAQRDLRAIENDLAHKRALLEQAEEAAAQLLERQSERRAAAERKGLFDELSQAFGKKGVQALLIETAIPEIEREANALLAGMTDNQMHLTFETQRDTKKGDVSETLDIKIADALGTRDYDAYSGGESFRVDFAIRVALAKLLARRAGARLETLVIDEGFGSQDARGRERLVEAITAIQHDFKQILVVTHIQELKDMFPVQIEIVKTPEGSRWSIA